MDTVAQLVILDATDPNDKWEVDLTSVVLSEDKLTATVVAYLGVSEGSKFEVRLMDKQFYTDLPLGGYNILSDDPVAIDAQSVVAKS
ncbi:MAG: hypothetical protein HC896_04875 [Bacteroidales bacterium]|nr:hypothetical protein [Bacteroidales bacterium]